LIVRHETSTVAGGIVEDEVLELELELELDPDVCLEAEDGGGRGGWEKVEGSTKKKRKPTAPTTQMELKRVRHPRRSSWHHQHHHHNPG
jgi:hypothetical protein